VRVRPDAGMRAADRPMHYLVGTPKGRLTRLEKHLIRYCAALSVRAAGSTVRG